MCLYVVIVTMVLVELAASAPPPLRVTIDCGSDEDPAQISRGRSGELYRSNSRFDVASFCSLIHRAIPNAVQNGRFITDPEPDSDYDQEGYSDSISPVAVAPPSGFISKLGLQKLKIPKLGIPTLNVPKLKPIQHSSIRAPKIGSPMSFTAYRRVQEEETSAERMEKFKKGVQTMLHFVKVLGKIDQYISERTRIVIDKLAKTFTD